MQSVKSIFTVCFPPIGELDAGWIRCGWLCLVELPLKKMWFVNSPEFEHFLAYLERVSTWNTNLFFCSRNAVMQAGLLFQQKTPLFLRLIPLFDCTAFCTLLNQAVTCRNRRSLMSHQDVCERSACVWSLWDKYGGLLCRADFWARITEH